MIPDLILTATLVLAAVVALVELLLIAFAIADDDRATAEAADIRRITAAYRTVPAPGRHRLGTASGAIAQRALWDAATGQMPVVTA